MVISLVFSILTAYILYKCFESGGFKRGFIFVLAFNIIQVLIQNETSHFLLVLGLTALISLVTTIFDYLIFTKTDSFMSYFVVSIIIGAIISFVLAMLVLPLVI